MPRCGPARDIGNRLIAPQIPDALLKESVGVVHVVHPAIGLHGAGRRSFRNPDLSRVCREKQSLRGVVAVFVIDGSGLAVWRRPVRCGAARVAPVFLLSSETTKATSKNTHNCVRATFLKTPCPAMPWLPSCLCFCFLLNYCFPGTAPACLL